MRGEVRFQLKILGTAYMALGGLMTAFVLFVLVLGILTYFGFSTSESGQGLSDAIVVFLALIYPAWWLIQTGYGLYAAQRSARMWGIIVAAVLLVGLNVALLAFGGEGYGAGRGFWIFHGVMILLGIYSLVLLVPKKILAYMND